MAMGRPLSELRETPIYIYVQIRLKEMYADLCEFSYFYFYFVSSVSNESIVKFMTTTYSLQLPVHIAAAFKFSS